MNKYRRLNNSDERSRETLPTAGDYLDNNQGRILVVCEGGVMKPDIFTSETQWCARGCPNLDPNFLNNNNMRVEYPRGSLSLNSFTAPVVRDVNLDIGLSCKTGFGITRDSYNRSTSTNCSLTGYKPSLKILNYQECVAGCTDPTLVLSNIRPTGNSPSPNNQGVYSAGDTVTLECVSSEYTLVGPGFRECRGVGGGQEGAAWDPPLTVVRCVEGKYTVKSGGLSLVFSLEVVMVGLVLSLVEN